MDQRYPDCTDRGYTRRVHVELCSLRQDASIDRPSYRYATFYDIDLGPDDFQTLDGLKKALQNRTKAGFLKTQFFRIRIKYRNEDASSSATHFLSSSQDVRAAYEAAQSQTDDWSLFVVRYTKAQSAQLQAKVSQEEYQHLRSLLGNKRKYERHVKVIHDKSNYSVIKVSNKEGIIHTDEYVDTSRSPDSSSVSSATSIHTLSGALDILPGGLPAQSGVGYPLSLSSPSYSQPNKSFIKNNIYSVCDPADLFSFVNSILSSAEDSTVVTKSLIPTSLFHVDGIAPSQLIPLTTDEHEDAEQNDATREASCTAAEINDNVEKIKLESPVGKLFSSRGLEKWALEILRHKHTAHAFPPAHFPIPDAYETRGFKQVAVWNNVLDISALYATFLSHKYPVPRGYSASEYKPHCIGHEVDADADGDDEDEGDGDGYGENDNEENNTFKRKSSANMGMHLFQGLQDKNMLRGRDEQEPHDLIERNEDDSEYSESHT